MGNTMQKTAKL